MIWGVLLSQLKRIMMKSAQTITVPLDIWLIGDFGHLQQIGMVGFGVAMYLQFQVCLEKILIRQAEMD